VLLYTLGLNDVLGACGFRPCGTMPEKYGTTSADTNPSKTTNRRKLRTGCGPSAYWTVP
jgi:hypothetical protein